MEKAIAIGDTGCGVRGSLNWDNVAIQFKCFNQTQVHVQSRFAKGSLDAPHLQILCFTLLEHTLDSECWEHWQNTVGISIFNCLFEALRTDTQRWLFYVTQTPWPGVVVSAPLCGYQKWSLEKWRMFSKITIG
jgi:hypothetical protein